MCVCVCVCVCVREREREIEDGKRECHARLIIAESQLKVLIRHYNNNNIDCRGYNNNYNYYSN